MKIKTKINKWDLIKLKIICTAKETINKMKRQSTEWKEIFTNEVNEKGLISQMYKHFKQLNNIKQPTQKMGRGSKKTFIQRKHTDGQKAYEKMLNIANY